MGLKSQGPFIHATGRGWVKQKDGQYKDALVRTRARARVRRASEHSILMLVRTRRQASPFPHKRGGCHSAPWQPLGCGGAELGSKKVL